VKSHLNGVHSHEKKIVAY